ncbi:hypothetical protein N9J26_00650 [bacterium]|nr:hypothetical protein [bacterium]
MMILIGTLHYLEHKRPSLEDWGVIIQEYDGLDHPEPIKGANPFNPSKIVEFKPAPYSALVVECNEKIGSTKIHTRRVYA